MELAAIRDLAEQTVQYEWHRGVQQADEFWDSSLLVEGAFEVVVEMMEYVRAQYKGKPLAVDLGAADGVIVLLMRYCGFQGYGIEKVAARLEVARRSCAGLQVGLALGDWTGEGSYKELGVGVEAFDFFYIYPSPHGMARAFALVGEKAKVGARLAVNMTTCPAAYEIPDCLALDVCFEGPMGDIHVYQKIDRTFTELSF